MRDSGTLAEYDRETNAWKNPRDDRGGEGMRFIGKHGERIAVLLQGFQQLDDSGVGKGSARPSEIVVGLEGLLERVDKGLIRVDRHRTLDKNPRAVPDESSHRLVGVGR